MIDSENQDRVRLVSQQKPEHQTLAAVGGTQLSEATKTPESLCI